MNKFDRTTMRPMDEWKYERILKETSGRTDGQTDVRRVEDRNDMTAEFHSEQKGRHSPLKSKSLLEESNYKMCGENK